MQQGCGVVAHPPWHYQPRCTAKRNARCQRGRQSYIPSEQQQKATSCSAPVRLAPHAPSSSLLQLQGFGTRLNSSCQKEAKGRLSLSSTTATTTTTTATSCHCSCVVFWPPVVRSAPAAVRCAPASPSGWPPAAVTAVVLVQPQKSQRPLGRGRPSQQPPPPCWWSWCSWRAFWQASQVSQVSLPERQH